jgi:hypothetical protein
MERNEDKLPGMGGVYRSQNLNLYLYTQGNPVNYVDPDGRLAFFWHFIISFKEAYKAGLGFWDSLKVGWYAMMYDFRKGSQTTEAANSHAMIRPKQSPEDAKAGTESFITKRLELGTLRGLGEATHAEADKPAGGHKDKVWEGFSKLGIWGTIKHLWDDTFPSGDVQNEASRNVSKTIEKWKATHKNDVNE